MDNHNHQKTRSIAEGQNVKYLKIGPADFINPPFITCPNCGKQSYGVLGIHGDSYSRRCKDCLYPNGQRRHDSIFPLPAIKKCVIYIDQFAISNMMKALNPETDAHKKGTLPKFWHELFARLDTLCKAQLIVCPQSFIHVDESRVTPFYNALKKMYELLSGDAVFQDPDSVLRSQLLQHARNWIAGNADNEIALTREDAFFRDFDHWKDRIQISMNSRIQPEWFEEYRENRQRVSEALARVFQRWTTEQDRAFEDWFFEEICGYGKRVIKSVRAHLNRQMEIHNGLTQPSLNDLFGSGDVTMFHLITKLMRESGLSDEQAIAKAIEFLQSPSLQKVPAIKISSMLWAAIARRAAKQGRKKPPNQGMSNDIDLISTYLPFCDAMFIDNECRSLLMESPLREDIAYGTKIFSQKIKDEFFKYLDGIEKNAPEGHFKAIMEVYGDGWRQPYVSLYSESKDHKPTA